jgi:hypothetical protein
MTIRELIDRVPEEKWNYNLIIEIPDRNFNHPGMFSDTETIDWVDKIDDCTMKVTLGY